MQELSIYSKQAGFEMIEFADSLSDKIDWARGGIFRMPCKSVLHVRGH